MVVYYSSHPYGLCIVLTFEIASRRIGRDMRKKIPDTGTNPMTNVKPAPTPIALSVVEATATASIVLEVARSSLLSQVKTEGTITIPTPRATTTTIRNQMTSSSISTRPPRRKVAAVNTS